MSAPEPQVRIHTLASPAGWAYWTCEGCGYRSIAKAGEISLRHARRHSDVCKRLALARLQARWDARDEALRALIEKWRAEADKLRAAARTHPYGSTSSLSCAVLEGAARSHADKLERAIGTPPRKVEA